LIRAAKCVAQGILEYVIGRHQRDQSVHIMLVDPGHERHRYIGCILLIHRSNSLASLAGTARQPFYPRLRTI
jgi:hypothetical protein